MAACDDRPNLVERVIFKLGEPKNQARLLQAAWKISLLMMVFGIILMVKTVSPDFM
ncbi:hypothetical protein [Methanosarcina sp. UBA5]|uniref:hypothetical protein n=1 Tax=Methanosarcina sp. UBA5 TaxID=1915593 RepID=UPI0025CBE6E7|nr:hypothetical protein [Methanosarcina sp. UBA5]